MDNKLARINSSVRNLDRIASLRDKPIIIGELKKAVGKSGARAAIVVFTKDQISRKELANKLGVDLRNLPALMEPFLGNRNYITETTQDRQVFYQRSELIELVELEDDNEFKELFQSWQSKRPTQQTQPNSQAQTSQE